MFRLLPLLVLGLTPWSLVDGQVAPEDRFLVEGREWTLLETRFKGCPEWIEPGVSTDFSDVDSVYSILGPFRILGEETLGGIVYKEIGFGADFPFGRFFREDTINNRVYRYQTSSVPERIYIDMGLHLEDSVNHIFPFKRCNETVKVVIEDTVMYAGRMRRRLGMTMCHSPSYAGGTNSDVDCDALLGPQYPMKDDTVYWHQGIGSNVGFLGATLRGLSNPIARLICLTEPDGSNILSIVDSTYSCDSVFIDFPNAIEPIEAADPKACLNEYETVVAAGSRGDRYAVVYDLNGQEVFHSKKQEAARDWFRPMAIRVIVVYESNNIVCKAMLGGL